MFSDIASHKLEVILISLTLVKLEDSPVTRVQHGNILVITWHFEAPPWDDLR